MSRTNNTAAREKECNSCTSQRRTANAFPIEEGRQTDDTPEGNKPLVLQATPPKKGQIARGKSCAVSFLLLLFYYYLYDLLIVQIGVCVLHMVLLREESMAQGSIRFTK